MVFYAFKVVIYSDFSSPSIESTGFKDSSMSSRLLCPGLSVEGNVARLELGWSWYWTPPPIFDPPCFENVEDQESCCHRSERTQREAVNSKKANEVFQALL